VTRVLLTTVDLNVDGGVASYMRAVQPHFTLPVEYLVVGERPGPASERPGRVRRLVSDYVRYWRAVRGGRYDLVHLNPSLERKALLRDGLLVLLAQLAGVRVVVFFHGWVPSCERALDRRMPQWLFARSFLRADSIVVLANAFADRLRGWGYRGRIDVLATAVEDRLFDVNPSSNTSGLRVLFLARLERDKGVFTAVEAVRQLQERGLDVRLTVAGDGPAEPELREQLGQLRHAQAIGYVRGQAKLDALRESDVYLFPTEYGEGMPISVLEAMAAGLPVVTRPVGGLADFFVDGQMGYLSDSTDPTVFADLINLLFNVGLRKEIAAYNSEYAREHFTGLAAAAALEAIYSII